MLLAKHCNANRDNGFRATGKAGKKPKTAFPIRISASDDEVNAGGVNTEEGITEEV